jgi:hypothetical protein
MVCEHLTARRQRPITPQFGSIASNPAIASNTFFSHSAGNTHPDEQKNQVNGGAKSRLEIQRYNSVGTAIFGVVNDDPFVKFGGGAEASKLCFNSAKLFTTVTKVIGSGGGNVFEFMGDTQDKEFQSAGLRNRIHRVTSSQMNGGFQGLPGPC